MSYTRNSLGQVTAVTGNYGGAFTIASGMSYAPFGPLTGLTFGNGRVLSRSFDLEYRLAAQTTTVVQSLAFSLDPAGNVDAISDYVYGLNQSFGQDALHRITSESGAYGSKAYGYDANGNRTSQSGPTPQSLGYTGGSNRLASHNGHAVTLDAAGNTLANPAENRSFTYGSHNRMLEAYVGGVLRASYVYNGKGQRIRKIEAPSAGNRTLVYHYGPDGSLLGETIYDSGGAKIGERDYVWLGTLPLAQIERTFSGGVLTGSQLVYLHTDQLNTPRLATGTAGTVVWRWDSDAFGLGAANLDPDGDTIPTNVRLRFPGQYLDEETGLHYNYFRDYDAITGRYTQVDPIGLAGGLNTYIYAGGNPLRYVDLLGLQFWPSAIPWGGVSPRPTTLPFPGRTMDPIAMPMSPSGTRAKPMAEVENPYTGERQQCPRDCKGLLKQIWEHEEKLRQYQENPLAHDNLGFLSNVLISEARRRVIVDGRIRNLQKQIRDFKKQYQDCLFRNGAAI